MKPLPSAPITSEDFAAWIVGRPGWWSALFVLSIATDRRDAALMFDYESARSVLGAEYHVVRRWVMADLAALPHGDDV